MQKTYVLSVMGLNGHKYYHQSFNEDDCSGDTLTLNRKKAYRWHEDAIQNPVHECVLEGHNSGKVNLCSLDMYDEIEVDMSSWKFE